MWDQVWHPHKKIGNRSSVYFDHYVFKYKMGETKILYQKAAGIPWI
jgi:hypothetical protein